MDADFSNVARNLIFGSAADLAAARAAMEGGRAVSGPTASAASRALAQAARDSGKPEDYARAQAAGAADMAAAMKVSRVVMSKPIDHNLAVEAALSATLRAEAGRLAIEGSRSNCFVALNTATPTVAIASGAATGILTVSLPGSTEIVGYTMSAADTAFVMTSLQVNSWETNKGGFGIPIDNFLSGTRRDSQLAPLVGREWDGTVTISGNFTNVSAAGAIFHGFGILCRNDECHSAYQKSHEGDHFVSFPDVLATAVKHTQLR